MGTLQADIEALAADGFSGVVRVDGAGEIQLAAAYGFAHRGLAVANTLDTQFAIASGSKTLTALAVMSLVEDGTLALATTARSVLGSDLPRIHDDVTVEQLLAHRSGIGDYLDENAGYDVDDYAMAVPVQQLVTTEDFLAVLDGYETQFPPGERFAYNNGGYVVLALIAERASGVPYHDLIDRCVCEPAGMVDSAFLRSDELPGRAALGYLATGDGSRTNVFHLPVRGSGDGGIYTTVRDVSSFWAALFAGRIVSAETVAEMVRPRSTDSEDARRYGLGFWLARAGDVAMLEGSDAGVSFWSAHDPGSGVTSTVISNSTDGAWPIARLLRERFSS
jgi:CubicO group peptidase (beta-lactamase class C family)